MRRFARLVLDYLGQAAIFLSASTDVAAFVTIVLPFIGYATFGDRPRPGWYGRVTRSAWSALGELAEYALALPLLGAIPVLIGFIVPFAVVTCAEAMSFYHGCFGARLVLTKLGDTPMKSQFPPAKHGRIINANLKSGLIEISATTGWPPPHRREPPDDR